MITFVLNGLCWIVAGVCDCLKGRVFGIISILAMAVGMIFILSFFLKKRQAPDEMATANLNQAAATAYFIGHMVLLVLYLATGKFVTEIIGIKVNLTPFISGGILALLGILNVIVGLGFKKLEDE